jgi:sugar phosphate isomerase/epimerase
MRVIEKNGIKIGVVEAPWFLKTAADVLDVIGEAGYAGCGSVILMEEALPASFFDLSSRMAGEFLQKFVNYRLQVAIVGEFGKFSSKSLKDFMYESNKGREVMFLSSETEAIQKISGDA